VETLRQAFAQGQLRFDVAHLQNVVLLKELEHVLEQINVQVEQLILVIVLVQVLCNVVLKDLAHQIMELMFPFLHPLPTLHA